MRLLPLRMPMNFLPALTLYRGRAGDRNPRGMAGAALVADAWSRAAGLVATPIGTPAAPLGRSWDVELDAARADLRLLAGHYDELLAARRAPLTAMGRCACALATLPAVARRRPEARIVWFDAHADANTPATSTSGYLGGLVLTGVAGLWESGLGDGLALQQVVLVGSRDIDPPERQLIDTGALRLVPPGPELGRRLAEAVADAPVYVHLDCDVLEPGIVPTEYRVPGGLSLAQLREAAEVLARRERVGLEVAEFESTWTEDGPPACADELVAALQPLWQA